MREIPAIVPRDQYNEKLAANTHPAEWINPEPQKSYNLVVIGAGTAGLVTAAGAAGLGARVALIEKHFLGGDCLNVGCVPSKCVIRSSRAVREMRDAARFGIRTPASIEPDFGAVMARMRKIRSDISAHDSVQRFTALGEIYSSGPARSAVPRRSRSTALNCTSRRPSLRRELGPTTLTR